MAYLVQRPQQRFEIRESEATPRGPRARTLVTFREFSDDVLDAAQARARGALDRAGLRARAIALGVSMAPPASHRAAYDLLVGHARGERLPVALHAVLRHVLYEEPAASAATVPVDHLVAMLPWLAASDTDRATALADLLGLADALPAPPRGELRYPQMVPR